MQNQYPLLSSISIGSNNPIFQYKETIWNKDKQTTNWTPILRLGNKLDTHPKIMTLMGPSHCGHTSISILNTRFYRCAETATGNSLITYIQNLRIEEAKRLLETTKKAVDEISYDVSYDDTSFFRRLFKRLTGLTPSQYRRMFQPVNVTKLKMRS